MSLLIYFELAVVEMAAGSPVEYLPFVEWRDVRLPSWANEQDRFVVVRVCGDSLLYNSSIPIRNGDFALVYLTPYVREGDLAAVLGPEGMMLKFVHNEPGGRIRLDSANPDFPPKYYDASEVTVQGRVVRTEHDW